MNNITFFTRWEPKEDVWRTTATFADGTTLTKSGDDPVDSIKECRVAVSRIIWGIASGEDVEPQLR